MKLEYLLRSFPLALLIVPAFGCLEPDDMDGDHDEYYDEVHEEWREEEEGDADDTSTRCSCVCGLSNHKGRIVGGQRVQPHEFPWLAAMVRDGKVYCAASLVTRVNLLTAAHCVRGFHKKDIKLVLGAHDRGNIQLTSSESNEMEMRSLANITLHPDFDPLNFDNDIAVLTMDKPVEFGSKISPACMPIRKSGNYTGEMAVAVGWGRTNETQPISEIPRKVEVVVMSKEECDQSGYGADRITSNMFCAGYTDGGRDSCQGDSGGPLHVFNKGGSTELIGVVSWGRGCARKNFPGIYTKLTRFTDFIQQNIEKNCLCRHL